MDRANNRRKWNDDESTKKIALFLAQGGVWVEGQDINKALPSEKDNTQTQPNDPDEDDGGTFWFWFWLVLAILFVLVIIRRKKKK